MSSTINSGDWKAMVQACQVGDVETVRYYLNLGVDPNFQHPEIGSTALHEAALHGHLEIVKMLVVKGASQEVIRDFGGGTPYEVAKEANQSETANWLESQKPQGSKGWKIWRRKD